jgi:hypothetical protein
LGNFLASFNDILQDACTKDMSKRGLSTLHKGSADISDSKSCLIRIDNVEVDDGGNVDVDIIFGHTHLRWNFDDCNFNIDLLQFFT